MIYLDTAANSKVDKKSLDVFYDACEKYYANPNSIHKVGLEVKEKIDESTSTIAKYLGVKEDEIIYTSGSSESNNLAIKGIYDKYKNRGNTIITTPLEHSSIYGPLDYLINQGVNVEFVKLDSSGLVDLDDLKRLLNDDVILVSINAVNSELGILQPIDEISKIVHKNKKTIFHSDITQAVGKIPIDLKNIELKKELAMP